MFFDKKRKKKVLRECLRRYGLLDLCVESKIKDAGVGDGAELCK